MKLLHVSFKGKYGLSNRIRSMAGHYAFSRIKGFSFTYDWIYDESCPGLFSDVFEPVLGVQCLDYGIENVNLNLSEYMHIHSGSKPTNCGSPPEHIFNTFFHDNTDLKVEFSKFVMEFYSLLRPSKRVLEISEETFSNFTGRNVLGIHVRRTDMLDHMKNIGMEPPTDASLVY